MARSLLTKLTKIGAGKKPKVRDLLPPPLVRRDNNSPRARAYHARMRRALAKRAETAERSRYAPKRVWVRPGRREPQPPLGVSVLHRLIAVMEPGEWYSWPDIGRAAGLAERDWIGVRKFTGGFVTRRQNPSPAYISERWLYSLTPRGEQLRQLLSLLE
jgi:hypothetical protein